MPGSIARRSLVLQRAGLTQQRVRKLGSLEQKWNKTMAASSSFMISEAERRFPVRIRIGVPSDGLGSRLDRIKSWLDENCGASGWAMTPSGTRGVLNVVIPSQARRRSLDPGDDQMGQFGRHLRGIAERFVGPSAKLAMGTMMGYRY